MRMDPGWKEPLSELVPAGHEAALTQDAHRLGQPSIGVPVLLLGTTVGTSSHSMSALFANLLTVPPSPQVPFHRAVNMLPSN